MTSFMLRLFYPLGIQPQNNPKLVQREKLCGPQCRLDGFEKYRISYRRLIETTLFESPAHRPTEVTGLPQGSYTYFYKSALLRTVTISCVSFRQHLQKGTSRLGLLETLHKTWTTTWEKDVKFFLQISIFCSMPNVKAAPNLVDITNFVCDGGRWEVVQWLQWQQLNRRQLAKCQRA